MAVDDTAEPSPKKLKKTLPKPAKFTKARLKKYFETYKDEDGQLGPEQMLKLCEDAKIDPADVGMLVLGAFVLVSGAEDAKSIQIINYAVKRYFMMLRFS